MTSIWRLYYRTRWRRYVSSGRSSHVTCCIKCGTEIKSLSVPESRKTAGAGRFESCGCQPIMFKITAWLVDDGFALRRHLESDCDSISDLGSSLGPDSSCAAPVRVADGIVLGSDYGR
jgi:hypothetical protein